MKEHIKNISTDNLICMILFVIVFTQSFANIMTNNYGIETMLISFSTYLYYVAMIKFHNKQNLSILLLNFYFILAIINKYIECKDIGKAISSVGILFIICMVAFTVYVFWQSHKVLKNGDKVTFKNTVLIEEKLFKLKWYHKLIMYSLIITVLANFLSMVKSSSTLKDSFSALTLTLTLIPDIVIILMIIKSELMYSVQIISTILEIVLLVTIIVEFDVITVLDITKALTIIAVTAYSYYKYRLGIKQETSNNGQETSKEEKKQ